MKSIVLAIVALVGAAVAGAQESARVLSSTPVIGQVAVPRQFCQVVSVVAPGQRHGAGAAIGALTGAIVGSSLGHGSGRAAGSVLGMVGGAVIGDQLAGRDTDRIEQVRQCTTHTAFENRVLHYEVVYEYAGHSHVAHMPYDPGPTVQVQVTPVGVVPPAPVAAQPLAGVAPMQVAPTITTIHSATEFVYYGAPPHANAIIIGLPLRHGRHGPGARHHQPHHGTGHFPHPPQSSGHRPHWR